MVSTKAGLQGVNKKVSADTARLGSARITNCFIIPNYKSHACERDLRYTLKLLSPNISQFMLMHIKLLNFFD
ncbi:MAG: hypothetical protein TECD_01158 [Hyphomicrobiaceae bacterium hypho_1]